MPEKFNQTVRVFRLAVEIKERENIFWSRRLDVLDRTVGIIHAQNNESGVGGGDGDFSVRIRGAGRNTPNTFLTLANLPHTIFEFTLEALILWQLAVGNIRYLMFGKVSTGQDCIFVIHGLVIRRLGFTTKSGARDQTEYQCEWFHGVMG